MLAVCRRLDAESRSLAAWSRCLAASTRPEAAILLALLSLAPATLSSGPAWSRLNASPRVLNSRSNRASRALAACSR